MRWFLEYQNSRKNTYTNYCIFVREEGMEPLPYNLYLLMSSGYTYISTGEFRERLIRLTKIYRED